MVIKIDSVVRVQKRNLNDDTVSRPWTDNKLICFSRYACKLMLVIIAP